MQERKQIGVVLIATNKYKQYVQQLIDSIEKNFLKNHNVTIFLFTDEWIDLYCDRTKCIQTIIPPYKFPYATLYRYIIMKQHELIFNQIEYLYYMDVDMNIENEVSEEIFKDLVAVLHPGFYNGGWGSSKVSHLSLAYVEPSKRVKYYAGGFQGGEADVYLNAAKKLASNILDDQINGVMAEWHDESHWNWYCKYVKTPYELNPSYCMVEDLERRKLWGIIQLEPKIVALNKKHEEVRI